MVCCSPWSHKERDVLTTTTTKKEHVFSLGSPNLETGFRRNGFIMKCSWATISGSESRTGKGRSRTVKYQVNSADGNFGANPSLCRTLSKLELELMSRRELEFESPCT